MEWVTLSLSSLSSALAYKVTSSQSQGLMQPVLQPRSFIPFGGMNIIFAGDFAQLPPVMAKLLYDHTVGTSTTSSITLRDKENAIGKAIWHQITTVVILKQNMRQRSQSSKNAKFRTALENMRYKSCTNEDIDFLRTLIANNGSILS